MKTLFFFLCIFSIKSFATTTPTLLYDCSSNTFTEQRMLAERASFGEDLDAELKYDAELFSQALVCTEKKVEINLSDCNLDKINIEDEKLPGLGLKKDDALALFKAKKEILQILKSKIEKCFLPKKASQMNASSLDLLYKNLKVLSQSPYDIFPESTTEFWSCRCKDGDKRYWINLGDIKALKDIDGKWKITVDRDPAAHYITGRGKD